MKLPMLAADKANHLAYGAALASLGALHSVLVGAALCGVLAISKEIYDRVSRKKGTADINDALATLAGGALVLLPFAVRLASA